MRHGKIGAEFQRALQRSDGGTVIAFFHERGTQVYKGVGEVRIDFRGFAELGDLRVYLVLLARLKAGPHVLQRIGRSTLPRQPKKEKPSHYKRSGSATSRNCSAATSFKTCVSPEGQITSTAALLAEPRPKCRRLSLAHR